MTPSIEISSTTASTNTTIPCKPFFMARLPLPPGINKSYKIIKMPNGHYRLAATPELMDFKERATVKLMNAEVDWSLVNAIRQSRLKTPLEIDICFYFSTLWKRDIDGGEKAVIDAVFHRLDLNDNLIVEKRTTKSVDRDEPHVEVEVRCLLGVTTR